MLCLIVKYNVLIMIPLAKTNRIKDILMDAKDYKAFVVQRDFSIWAIERFAKEQGVRSGARSRKGELDM